MKKLIALSVLAVSLGSAASFAADPCEKILGSWTCIDTLISEEAVPQVNKFILQKSENGYSLLSNADDKQPLAINAGMRIVRNGVDAQMTDADVDDASDPSKYVYGQELKCDGSGGIAWHNYKEFSGRSYDSEETYTITGNLIKGLRKTTITQLKDGEKKINYSQVTCAKS